jgi:hypothetical protein
MAKESFVQIRTMYKTLFKAFQRFYVHVQNFFYLKGLLDSTENHSWNRITPWLTHWRLGNFSRSENVRKTLLQSSMYVGKERDIFSTILQIV